MTVVTLHKSLKVVSSNFADFRETLTLDLLVVKVQVHAEARFPMQAIRYPLLIVVLPSLWLCAIVPLVFVSSCVANMPRMF